MILLRYGQSQEDDTFLDVQSVLLAPQLSHLQYFNALPNQFHSSDHFPLFAAFKFSKKHTHGYGSKHENKKEQPKDKNSEYMQEQSYPNDSGYSQGDYGYSTETCDN